MKIPLINFPGKIYPLPQKSPQRNNHQFPPALSVFIQLKILDFYFKETMRRKNKTIFKNFNFPF
jgi:hypothetical protein